MVKFFLAFLFFISLNGGYVDRFSYAEKNALDWSDFRGEPDSGSYFDSAVNTGITYQWSYSKEDGDDIALDFDVNSFCYPTLSWVKKGQTTAYLLAHEQLHFDISEIHARIMRKKLRDYKPTKGKDVRKDLNRMYKRVERMRINMQKKYDRDTDHSRNKEAQKAWEQKVKVLMWYYSAYKK